ncbi:hypothetical protein H2200_002841 [Cladophialophora chaetospira]|uniref:arginine--tRNA ligase n=1 Tax=Cladophialophora chaetospira TaxID=386627 RepID=A0AA38XG82_9EURO|nr:hypothetical protein H2200_002841 [Cladophialophora chaetospira]
MATTSKEGLERFLDAIGIPSQDSASISSEICSDPLAICFAHLADLLVQLTECDPNVAYKSIVWSGDLTHLVVVAPRLRIKNVKADDLAADLQRRFPPSELFGHPAQDGINLLFFFNHTTLARLLLPYIVDRGPSYGKHLPHDQPDPSQPKAERKKVVVDFSSPNLVGTGFNGLHLRSTIIGGFLASTYETLGWDVVRLNFLGDWGKPIGLLAAGWSKFGSEESLETDPLKHVSDVYGQIEQSNKDQQAARKAQEGEEDSNALATTEIEAERDQCCKRLEEGDQTTLDLWKKFRDLCVTRYIELYARLGITFDEYSGESQVTKDTIEEVENTLRDNDVYHETEEGWMIEFSKPEEKGLGSIKGRSSDGTTTYLLRDIAAVLERNRKYSFDKMIYVVSARQTAHFQQVKKAVDLLGHPGLALKLEHFSFGDTHGLVPKEGASGLFLGDILDQCRDAAKLVLETDQDTSGHFFGHDPITVADALGAMNLTVEELGSNRARTVNIDINSMATAGDYTGLSLQKWYTIISTRLGGVHIDRAELETTDYSIFEGEELPYADVLRLLIQFPGIARTFVFEKLESSHVVTYLFNVLDLMPRIWEAEGEAESSVQSLSKLALYECLRQTLENGMRLFGLVPIGSPNDLMNDALRPEAT